MTQLDEPTRFVLQTIPITARRMLLETPGVAATVPMLRGVWGAALHDLDREVYAEVFDPQTTGGREASPRYVLRPAPPDPDFAPAIDWISIGTTPQQDRILCRAWDIASGMGLGPDRRRFHVRCSVQLVPGAAGSSSGAEQQDDTLDSQAWPLSDAGWPLDDPPTAACRLVFPSPLRIRRHGRLVEAPHCPTWSPPPRAA
jgi:hypothetical protein